MSRVFFFVVDLREKVIFCFFQFHDGIYLIVKALENFFFSVLRRAGRILYIKIWSFVVCRFFSCFFSSYFGEWRFTFPNFFTKSRTSRCKFWFSLRRGEIQQQMRITCIKKPVKIKIKTSAIISYVVREIWSWTAWVFERKDLRSCCKSSNLLVGWEFWLLFWSLLVFLLLFSFSSSVLAVALIELTSGLLVAVSGGAVLVSELALVRYHQC